ncbi:MAG: hypothetical protein FVQ84_08490 [Planctomycetes bacterium]|nr:hypothetical protein [Planctomycetota bacterium]
MPSKVPVYDQAGNAKLHYAVDAKELFNQKSKNGDSLFFRNNPTKSNKEIKEEVRADDKKEEAYNQELFERISSSYSVPELRAFAEQLGMEKIEVLKKSELVGEMIKHGFNPSAAAGVEK